MDETSRRFFGFETEKKLFQFRARTFDFNDNALRRIVDPTTETKFDGEAIDERPKAHALHRAANGEL